MVVPDKSGKTEYYKGHEIEIYYNGRYSFYIYFNKQFVQSKEDYTSYESCLRAAKRWIDSNIIPKKTFDNSADIAWHKIHEHGGSW